MKELKNIYYYLDTEEGTLPPPPSPLNETTTNIIYIYKMKYE